MHEEPGFFAEPRNWVLIAFILFFAIFGPRGQQLLQRKPALRPFLEDLHHHGGRARVDRADVTVPADTIVTGGIEIG